MAVYHSWFQWAAKQLTNLPFTVANNYRKLSAILYLLIKQKCHLYELWTKEVTHCHQSGHHVQHCSNRIFLIFSVSNNLTKLSVFDVFWWKNSFKWESFLSGLCYTNTVWWAAHWCKNLIMLYFPFSIWKITWSCYLGLSSLILMFYSHKGWF